MEKFETPGGTVRWASSGSGPPVVLLHGTPFSSYVWRDIAPALSERHEVFVWDMLGYGRSEKRDGHDVSLGTQAEIFASLLEHWGLESPSVVAHDFGGVVSLRVHLLHGARFDRLALVDVVAIAPWGTSFFHLVRDNPRVFEQLPSHLHEAIVRTQTATASAAGLRGGVLDELVAPWLGAEGQAAYYRQIAQADQRFTDEIEPLLGSLDLPVLVGWGEADEWIPVEQGKELASRIPGAGLRLFPGAGHLVQEDAPAALTATLLEFLGQPRKVA